jgi:hypothetical protein
MYCITFNRHNFDVLSVSECPLIPNRGHKKDIHFPCGVVYDPVKEMFYVSLGIDDINLGIFTIDKTSLDAAMVPVINPNSAIIKDHDFSSMITKEHSLWINSYGGCGNDMFVMILKRKGYKVYSELWDKIGCHYLIPQEHKPCLYMIVHPAVALASMFQNRTLSTNFRKLSNQTDIQTYTLTGLLYFMTKQASLWLRSSSALIVHGQNISTFSAEIENYFKMPHGVLKDYPKFVDHHVSNNAANMQGMISAEPALCNRLYEKCMTLFENYFLTNVQDSSLSCLFSTDTRPYSSTSPKQQEAP